jgi:putative ABC transport system substrate-binding protein
MKRRDFIALLSGAAAAWPMPLRAEQPDRMRRIGFLTALADDDLVKARIKALIEGLRNLGWVEGRNFSIDYRFAAGDVSRIMEYTAELVRLAPDLIIALNSPVVSALKQATTTIPIVFVAIADPVEQGFLPSLGHPGGNITGFTAIEPVIIGKMLELLKEMAPGLARAVVIFNPATGAYIPAHLRSFEAKSLGVALTLAPVREVAEIEATIAALAREPHNGIVVPPEPFNITHRKLIFDSAERHRVAAIYYYRSYIAEGALMSYGADQFDLFRRSASYVDRILKGAKPADLPVQQPVKYELAINLKAAKALGLDVSWFLQQRADEVIE